jgi:hypothetical protein
MIKRLLKLARVVIPPRNFDYSATLTCNRPVQYTLLEDQAALLGEAYGQAGCASYIYPAATGWFTATDASSPVPKINGNELPWNLVATASNVSDSSANVTFSASAGDDCDSNPSVAKSHAMDHHFQSRIPTLQ